MSPFGREHDEAPDYAAPFVAWRVWRVVSTRDGYRLSSVVKSTLWPPGEPFAAECLREPSLPTLFRRRRARAHEVPATSCECGIYAGRLSAIGTYIARPATAAVTSVVGLVQLWGTVMECERGYRASHAYPARLYVPVGAAPGAEERWQALTGALEVYGVPVELLHARASEAVRVLEGLDRRGLHMSSSAGC